MTERKLARSLRCAMASQPSLRLCLVDPSVSDWHQLKNGRSALPMDPERVDVWLVNVRLPDMTGFDLHQMLIQRLPSAFVALVDEKYSDQHERLARSSGAKLYFCKPPQIWWLDLLAHPPPG